MVGCAREGGAGYARRQRGQEVPALVGRQMPDLVTSEQQVLTHLHCHHICATTRKQAL